MSEGDSAKKLKEKQEEFNKLQKEREAEEKKAKEKQKQMEDDLAALRADHQKLQARNSSIT